jgi:hypothetical protein
MTSQVRLQGCHNLIYAHSSESLMCFKACHNFIGVISRVSQTQMCNYHNLVGVGLYGNSGLYKGALRWLPSGIFHRIVLETVSRSTLPPSSLMMEAISTSKTSVNFFDTTLSQSHLCCFTGVKYNPSSFTSRVSIFNLLKPKLV